MTNTQPLYRKLFTIEQANAMLPLVRAIVGDLSSLYRDLVGRHERLEHLASKRNATKGDPYSDELRQMEAELERDKVKLRDYVAELQELGIECKDPGRGLIDFPSEMDGKIVYLCWKLDEPEVLFWHDLDAGFAGRQSLTVGSAADSGDDFGTPGESE
jgi:hypothetical protein